MPRGPSSAGAPIGLTRMTRGVSQAAGDGRRDDDRAERVPEDDGAGRDGRRRTRRSQSAYAVDVVAPAGQRRRLAESGQVGRDDPDAVQVRDDRLESVVLAAEAVHGDDRRLGVRRAVHPVRRRAAEHLDLAALAPGWHRAARQ